MQRGRGFMKWGSYGGSECSLLFKCFGEEKAKLMPRQYLAFNSYSCLTHVSFLSPHHLLVSHHPADQTMCLCRLRIGWPQALNFLSLNKIYPVFSPFQSICVATGHTHNPQRDSSEH